MDWQEAPEIKKELEKLIDKLELVHLDSSRIFCYRTRGSKSRAYARIWSFPKIFQQALNQKPAYVIEVLSQYFDKLAKTEKTKVLIHEMMHIPKNFSGSLLPHKFGKKTINKEVKKLFNKLEEGKEKKNKWPF